MASLRAAERKRFTRDHAQFCVSAHHGNRIHDPGHRLRVGINVRRGNVSIWSDYRRNLESITARQTLQLVLRKALRIANHSTFTAAVRNVDSGALPCHPRGQRFYFFESDVRVITYAALRRPPRDVVLHAITLENFYFATIHLHGDRYDQLPLGTAQDVA